MLAYDAAVAALALLPQMRSGTGISRNTQHSTEIMTCRLSSPMALIHGVRAKRTTTEMALRVKTTPTSAFPII